MKNKNIEELVLKKNLNTFMISISNIFNFTFLLGKTLMKKSIWKKI